MNQLPIVADVCLVGGGHSHALLIRRWAMNPLPGVRLTLVSSHSLTPYSGMLPGFVAGHYKTSDIHIDLRRLCNWANVRFIENTVVGLNLQARQALLNERPPLSFDILSLDTGSTPDLSVPGAKEHVTAVKPVHTFQTRWQKLQDRLRDCPERAVSIGVVGSGAGGYELVSAVRYALSRSRARVFWFVRDALPLGGCPTRVGERALAAARRAGILVVTRADVVRVSNNQIETADGRRFVLDEILWCTAAVAPSWPAAAGLAVDSKGFVSTNTCLQSLSHPFVFATGDIGTQRDTPSAKAGVFAVRQAPYLHQNIRALLLGESLRDYQPQKHFLSLMATGGKRAIASRGPLCIEADWVWRWKDSIDRQFMRRFEDLPPMKPTLAPQQLPDALYQRYLAIDGDKEPTQPVAMRCRGCGGKVGETVLERVLAQLPARHSQHGNTNMVPAGDAAILSLPARPLVQSVDQINDIVDDPWLLGRIATLHALSDVLTVDAKLHSVQLLISVPAGTEAIVERDLTLLIQGVVDVLHDEDAYLVGGHTVQGDELSVGLVVNAIHNGSAVAVNESTSDNTGMACAIDDTSTPSLQIDDALILTQSQGIATLFAGLMQQKAAGPDILAALDRMQQSNRRAADILRNQGAHFMTDVTGFGLLGHLQRLMSGLNCSARLQHQAVPLLPGALALAEQGVRSSLWPENRQVISAMNICAELSDACLSLLCDPQTGGGLLAIVPGASSDACLRQLHLAGYSDAAQVGALSETSTDALPDVARVSID